MPARLLREPMFAFLIAGAAIFAAYSLLESRRREPVRLSAETRAALASEHEALTGAPADAAVLARLEREYIAEELLFRAALAEGRHLSDGTVRARLVGQMRLEVAGLLQDPDEEQLVNYYSEHLDRYRSEPTVSFEQAYFRARPADPDALRAKLQGGGPAGEEPAPFGAQFTHYGRSMLRGLFGQQFVEALWAAPLGEWSGPVQSIEGWHFVRPAERRPGVLLPFDAVRRQIEADFMATQVQEAVDRRVAELATQYEIEILR